MHASCSLAERYEPLSAVLRGRGMGRRPTKGWAVGTPPKGDNTAAAQAATANTPAAPPPSAGSPSGPDAPPPPHPGTAPSSSSPRRSGPAHLEEHRHRALGEARPESRHQRPRRLEGRPRCRRPPRSGPCPAGTIGGCRGRNRTSTKGFKVPCPTVRRPGNGAAARAPRGGARPPRRARACLEARVRVLRAVGDRRARTCGCPWWFRGPGAAATRPIRPVTPATGLVRAGVARQGGTSGQGSARLGSGGAR